MITFEFGIDARCRDYKAPCVARFSMGDGTYRYIVIGTEYGYIHTSGGDIRTWGSYSGAYRFAKQYQSF